MKKQDNPLAGLLKNIISDLSSGGKLSNEDISEAWKSVVGKRAFEHARPVSIRNSVVVVNVDASSWLYELTTKKREILKNLSKRLKDKKVKDIRFRIGEIR